MSINSEKRERKDARARRRWQSIVNVLAYLFVMGILVLIIGLLTYNTDVVVWSFVFLCIICGPLAWMAPGRMKDWGKDYIPWWWGGL